jgi:hypothetical protein
MREELGDAHGGQGSKQERSFHLVSKRKIDLTNKKISEKAIVKSPIAKHSHRTKAEMTMVKVKKAIMKEVHEAKKFAKLVEIAKLGSTKELPKMPKSNREKTFRPLNPKGKQRRASKDTIQVVEQL